MKKSGKRCSHIIVHCIDFRTQKVADRLRASLGVSKRDCDRVSVAGGAAAFEQLQYNLEISRRLHESSTAILTVHEDCGAGAKRSDLTKAADISKKLGFNVRAFLLLLNGHWEEVLV